jgi:hypothetical protein
MLKLTDLKDKVSKIAPQHFFVITLITGCMQSLV